MATEITLSLTEVTGALVTTGAIVAAVVTWVVRRNTTAEVRAEGKVEALRTELGDIEKNIFGVIDRHKAENRTEFNKVWDKFEFMNENTASRYELQNLERKLENQFDRIEKKLDAIVDIAVRSADHEARLKSIEDIMKVD